MLKITALKGVGIGPAGKSAVPAEARQYGKPTGKLIVALNAPKKNP
jgi:hypothetical protein